MNLEFSILYYSILDPPTLLIVTWGNWVYLVLFANIFLGITQGQEGGVRKRGMEASQFIPGREWGPKEVQLECLQSWAGVCWESERRWSRERGWVKDSGRQHTQDLRLSGWGSRGHEGQRRWLEEQPTQEEAEGDMRSLASVLVEYGQEDLEVKASSWQLGKCAWSQDRGCRLGRQQLMSKRRVTPREQKRGRQRKKARMEP